MSRCSRLGCWLRTRHGIQRGQKTHVTEVWLGYHGAGPTVTPTLGLRGNGLRDRQEQGPYLHNIGTDCNADTYSTEHSVEQPHTFYTTDAVGNSGRRMAARFMSSSVACR